MFASIPTRVFPRKYVSANSKHKKMHEDTGKHRNSIR